MSKLPADSPADLVELWIKHQAKCEARAKAAAEAAELGGVLDVHSIGGYVVQPRRNRSVAGSFRTFKWGILDVALPVIGRQEIPSVVDAVDVHGVVDVIILDVSYLDNLSGTLLNLNSVLSRFRLISDHSDL